MKARNLRHRIVIQQPTLTQDAVGGHSVTFSDQETRWASVSPMRGDERLTQEKLEHKVTHKIRIRKPGASVNGAYWMSNYFMSNYFMTNYWDSVGAASMSMDVLPKMRIKFGTRFFAIREIKNIDERNITIEMICEEVFE